MKIEWKGLPGPCTPESGGRSPGDARGPERRAQGWAADPPEGPGCPLFPLFPRGRPRAFGWCPPPRHPPVPGPPNRGGGSSRAGHAPAGFIMRPPSPPVPQLLPRCAGTRDSGLGTAPRAGRPRAPRPLGLARALTLVHPRSHLHTRSLTRPHSHTRSLRPAHPARAQAERTPAFPWLT